MVDTRSRTRNSARNALFGAAAFVLKTLLQFFVRALFIRFLTYDYLGLNGLYSNVLNVLSLAELGVGNAIVYSMYKPVADGDTEKIKSLLALYKKLYCIIGAVVTALGLALIPALPYLVTDAPDLNVNLTAVYVLFLAQTVVGYFFAYRRSLVFAYQRNDVESKVSLVTQIVLAAAQVLILVLWRNYYAYVGAMVVCNLLDALAVLLISFKLFPEIRGKAQKLPEADRKEISANTRALFLHKIGGAAVFSSDSIIISAFISTHILGLYSNYTLVTGAFAAVATLFCTALRGSIGNFLSTSDPGKSLPVFHALNLALFWLVGFFTIGMVCCFQDFIGVFTSDGAARLDTLSVLLICVSFYFTNTRGVTGAFKECAGLFRNDRYKALVEAALNLGLDFALVFPLGLPGVLIATIASSVLVPLWVEPFVLYKHYFHKGVSDYLLRYIACACVTAAAGSVAYLVCSFIPGGGVWIFLAKVGICCVLVNGLFLLAYFRTPSFRYLLGAAKRLLHKDRG